ncbi:MAG: hypothetical protein GX774_01370 [Armatimonadetes bacterium]|jgi:hypothetical protein|nr:hypothetical protein [Armatimonadota bacterium]
MPQQSDPVPAWLEGHAESIRSEEDAVAFVDAVGFCLIDRPERGEFPSLAAAFPGAPDSVLGRVWFWKDDLHIQRRLYYTRLFAGRPGFISTEWLPLCIAAYGEVADELIFSGRLSHAAREVYQILEREGPLPSREVRRALSAEARHRADSALADLERRFIITKTGLTGRTRGTYGYLLDLAERWVPEAFSQAGRLRREEATARILARLGGWGLHPGPRFPRRLD